MDDLCPNLTVPGTDVELMEGGLSPHNIDSCLKKLCDRNVEMEPKHQFEAIRLGFDKVLSLGKIELFYAEELKQLICCVQCK